VSPTSTAVPATIVKADPAVAQQVKRTLDSIQNWVEGHDYRGYEPFDGLASWARPLAFGNQLLERVLQQAIRQSPINLRPLMGVRRKESTKGRGYMAWGYLSLYRATKEQQYLDKATACLEWLDKHKVARFEHHSWSNAFDFVSRGGGYTSDDPIIVWTSSIGQAYLEAFEITGNEWFLKIADSVGKWILALPREKTPTGDCLSYLADRQSSIHNANMLGSALLARLGKFTRNQECFDVSRSAMQYSCSRQLEDGAWWYAEAPKYHWIDNFHTGYNLDSIEIYTQTTGDKQFVPNMEKGLEFYKAHFFEENGRPKYYHTRAYPIDIQCAAQSIDTLALLGVNDPQSLELSKKVALWTINNMQSRKGYFYYRQYPMATAKTPMLHWGQATMFKGLAELYLRLQSNAVQG
jgi:rhamnogalacturonyl hydrolase YesR